MDENIRQNSPAYSKDGSKRGRPRRASQKKPITLRLPKGSLKNNFAFQTSHLTKQFLILNKDLPLKLSLNGYE